MLTKRTILTTALVLLCSACEGKAPPKDIDAMWPDLTSEERVAHLEDELVDARELMRAATTPEEWDGRYQDAQSALSLLRPEVWVDERERYLALESELEALAQETQHSP